MNEIQQIPVTVLSGYLGAGKNNRFKSFTRKSRGSADCSYC